MSIEKVANFSDKYSLIEKKQQIWGNEQVKISDSSNRAIRALTSTIYNWTDSV